MRKRKYLCRLLFTMLLGLILPAVVAFNVFWGYALRGWGEANEDFYENALITYTSLLGEKVKDLETFAARISVESRERDNVLQSSPASLIDNGYQLFKATHELGERYVRNDVSEWGIYFYDIDKIITSRYSYSTDDFLYKYSGGEQSGAAYADFFSEDNYSIGKTMFSSINASEEYSGYLMVGVCTRIGDGYDRAMVFYLLSPQDVNDFLAIVGGKGITYYLLDEQKENVLLTWGEVPERSSDEILASEEWKTVSGVKQKVLYNIKSNNLPLYVAAYVSHNSLQSNIIEWINTAKILMFCTLAVLLVTCTAALYISYKPMYKLTREIDYAGGNEFDVIRDRLDNQVSRIGEQHMLILDMLIEHLIYGVPISAEQFKRLGIQEAMHFYCVFLIDGHCLSNSEMEKLIYEMERDDNARIFITDCQEENSSVLIAFLKEEDVSGLQKMLELWMKENFTEECTLYTGKVYDELENIQMSFRSCLQQMKKKNDRTQKAKLDENMLTPKQEQQKKMAKEILLYLENNYRDPDLTQMQVADLFRISNYTLSRLFKSQVGVGFAEYLTAKRLEYAKELLLTTSVSVKEVSVMAGFTSDNYFSKSFKLYEGVSPSAFRNQ